MNFTVEEMNLLAIYVPGSRTQVMEGIRGALADVDEPDMREIMHSAIAILEGMADEDFAALDIFAEDDEDERAEVEV